MKKSTKIMTMLLMIAITLSVFAVCAYAEGAGEVNEETSNTIKVSFDFSRFIDSLQYMWKGMLCIFIVIGVIILAIYALNKAMNAIANRKSDRDN